jgi:glycosyltransferase involved in cell wall biosynthesis
MNETKSRIQSYLLAQLHAEICERESKRIDDRATYVRDRAREFYWTVSRLTRDSLGAAGLSKLIGRKKAPPRRLPLRGDIPRTASGPRLLIDVTPTHRRDIGSGIQRVVREVAKAAVESGEGLPVFMHEGRLYSHFEHPSLQEKIEIAEGDRFFMLDAAWAYVDEYRRMMEETSRRGGANIICVYDLLPLLDPASCPAALVRAFEIWFDELVCESDAVVAISRTVANEFREYASTHSRAPKAQRVGWWMLGADFGGDADVAPTRRTAPICSATRPFFLSVGTLAPTKGQAVSLEAFEKLWAEGVDVAFVVVGKRSWNTKALEVRLETHPERGRRLFWLEDASDDELRCLYRHARGVVCASYTEGFGLPLVEAAYHGAPVIASDIPIFRELGGDEIVYFDTLDSDALAQRLKDALTRPKTAPKLPALSWRESTHALTRLIEEDAYQFR